MERRKFIKTGTLATTSLLATPFYLRAKEEKIKLAILGTGWWGTELLLKYALKSGEFEIAALCDVNKEALGNAAAIVRSETAMSPKLFDDYREMFEMPGLDAVVISTPTHWHALQFIAACEKGLHVLLEKPISYDIQESLAMKKAYEAASNVVIVDFPRMMAPLIGEVKSFVQSGNAGEILQVKATINNHEGKLVEMEVPAHLDYEKFCGPAPKLKYLCSESNSQFRWRGQHGFNRGVMVDWGIHYIHNVRKVLDLGLPDTISAVGGTLYNHSSDNPDHLEVFYTFGDLPVQWSHKSWGYVPTSYHHGIGVYYYGNEATIFQSDGGWEVYTKDGNKHTHGTIDRNPQPDLVDLVFNNLFAEFSKHVKTNRREGVTNTFEDGFLTTATVNLGDISFRSEETLEIETSSLDLKNSSNARALLRREYREGYHHPYV